MNDEDLSELQELSKELTRDDLNKDTSEKENPEAGDTKDKLSKEEIKAEYDVQFAKNRGNKAQHLVSTGKTDAMCGVGLGSDVPVSDSPGPFDPLCLNCRRSIGENRVPEMNRSDLREWLKNNIDGVGEPSGDDPSQFKKKEIEAIVAYIRKISSE